MQVPRIYAIADQDAWGLERLPQAVETLAEAGVGWIQLRVKQAAGGDFQTLAEKVVRRLEGADVVLWINDRADIAGCLEGFGVPIGVHVGQDDLPPTAVRKVLGDGVRIGHSTHGESQLLAADAENAVDVIALGPIYATRSKAQPDPEVGLQGLRRLRSRTSKPLVAIGGINAERLPEVLNAGADTVALISALGDSEPRGLAKRVRELIRIAEEAK